MREFEFAGLIAERPREAAPGVPKELGLEEGLREAGAVHGNEVLSCAVALRMESACDELFANAAFPGNQDLCIGWCHLVNLLAQLRHQRTAAYQFTLLHIAHVSSTFQPASFEGVPLACWCK